jgi:hypothetical protein
VGRRESELAPETELRLSKESILGEVSSCVLSLTRLKRDFSRRVICKVSFTATDRGNEGDARAFFIPGQKDAAGLERTFDISARLMIFSAAARLSSSVHTDAIIRDWSNRCPERNTCSPQARPL